ncbi:MAG: DMT family transporter [Alphaproteobacteria bacterium]
MPTVFKSATAQAIFMMVCASATIALLWAVLRVASETMHPFYILFWRSVFGVLILLPIFVRAGPSALKTTRLPLHGVRSLSGIIAMGGIFYSVAHIPLGQAMAINYSGPLFATLGAVLILGEPIRSRRMIALAVGFVGMLIVVRPGVEHVNLGVLAALIGVVGMAGSLLSIKKLAETEANTTIIFYGNTLGLPISLAVVLALGVWQWMSWMEFGLLALIGLMSTVAQLFLNRALKLAEAGAVLPVDFLRLVFVTVLGAVLFDEQPEVLTWIGAGIILCSTVYIARRESRAPPISESGT